jgi:GINS complex subunit 4
MHYLILISPPDPYKNTQQSSQQQDTKLNQKPEDTIPNPTDPNKAIDPSPLSPEEASFLYSHQHLLASHFGSSFLNTFPPQLRRLDDNAGGTSMVQGPDLKEVVFVRCLAEEVRIVILADDILPEEGLGKEMRRGELWVTRWEGVKRAWEKGDVEVL